LPSLSEGFPVSVLESMSYGLIPLISEGCNFNEVFEYKLGERLEPDESQISSVLRSIASRSFDHELSRRNSEFINSRFAEKKIGEQLLNFYRSI
jgi:glycosyltransferase involved in cell wall biosynthesis